jgi:hypothetical protein
MNTHTLGEKSEIKAGMFSPCSGTLDPITHKYKLTDITELYKCCSRKCLEPENFCLNFCYKNHGIDKEFDTPLKLARCLRTCSDMKKLCLETCSMSSDHTGPDNNFLKCAKNYGCYDGYKPDRECLEKNKHDIFNCCRKTCIPLKNLNCQKHCEFNRDVLYKIDEFKESSNPTELKNLYNGNRRKKSDILFWIVIIIVIIIFLYNLYLVYLYKFDF